MRKLITCLVRGIWHISDVLKTDAQTRITINDPVDLGGRLAGLSLNQQILALALWPFLQNIMSVSVSFVDRVIAGNITESANQAAVMDMMGLMMYIGWLMMLMQSAIATGGQALVSRAFGARDYELANKALGQSLVLGVISGILSGLILWLLIPVFGDFFELNAIAKGYLEIYVSIFAMTAPLSGIMFVCNACLRGAGDTWTPFNAMVTVNLVNAPMSYILAVQLDMGIAGIAYGTLLGWVVGVAMILWKLYPRAATKSLIVLKKKWLKWNRDISRRILRVGAPQLVEILGMWAIHAYGIKLIASVGNPDDGLIGSHGLAVLVESISFMPGFALGTAAATLAGQYLGAGSRGMAMKAVQACWRVAIVVMGCIGVGLFFGAEHLVNIMSPGGGEQAQLAVSLVMIVAIAQPFFATAMVMKMSMRGAGATGTVMLYSYSTMLIFRVALMTIMVHYYGADLKMIWYIMTLDIVVQAVVFIFAHFRRKWMDAVV